LSALRQRKPLIGTRFKAGRSRGAQRFATAGTYLRPGGFVSEETTAMRRQIRPVQRNTLDLTDRVQVRTVTRKLRLSGRELTALVEKVGHSIAAINKEVNARRTTESVTPAALPPAAIIDAVVAQEPAIAAEAQVSAALT
jgi:hypothetical protein